MSPVAVVAIVLAVGEAKTVPTAGLVAAAEEAFVAGTAIRISEVPFPSDEAALVWENQLDARAAITVTWDDSTRLRAHIRMHVDRTDRWTDREFKFAPADSLRERGRTLGFAIASMWPDQSVVRPPRPPSPPPVAEQRSQIEDATRRSNREVAERLAESERKIARASEAAARAPEVDVAQSSDPSLARKKTATGSDPPSYALGLAGVIAEGIGGPAQGFGGTLDGALFLDQSFAVRLGVGMRVGSVIGTGTSAAVTPADSVELSGTDLVGTAALGIEWWLLPPSTIDALGFGLRVDALLIRHQVFDAEDSQGRWVPGADFVPEISIRLTDVLEAVLGAGVEVAFGTTEVSKKGVHVTTIPSLRVVSQAGLRLRF